MKTVLFIPGFRDNLHDRDYSAVLKIFELKGYRTKFVPITWHRTDLTDWLKEFNKTYKNFDSKDVVIAGFSFGAITAFAAAAERNPAELWLCSTSPYFEGDNPIQSDLQFIGKKRAEVFDNTDFPKLAKQIKCPTKILYGELEGEGIKHRAIQADKLIPNSTLIEIQRTRHEIAAKNYLKTFAENISSSTT
jgi:pimeloyl-ACP methyl ester carboxylesterase